MRRSRAGTLRVFPGDPGALGFASASVSTSVFSVEGVVASIVRVIIPMPEFIARDF